MDAITFWALIIFVGGAAIAIGMAAKSAQSQPADRGADVVAERRFEITNKIAPVRALLMVVFWLWGAGYGFAIIGMVFEASRMIRLGVGTSAAVSMHLLLWIGGILLLGIGAMMIPGQSTMRIHDPAPPEDGG